MRLGAAVGDAFRHRVGLGPDDVLAQIPAIGLQREGDAPGDADQVFRFQAMRYDAALACAPMLAQCRLVSCVIVAGVIAAEFRRRLHNYPPD